ncbi:hypothetical protein [Chitinophaga rhizosphaerae]|uniref:hypothetical protein n=1 Tax=Chitinophaga rhizosphaerae TaxID=1864947 RepID=UPI000F80FEDF|nr:hypothetical protein [Chitinophaga rhizosphaerae]
MSVEDFKEEGKSLFEKIPDIAFDWYARIIPGFICAFLVIYAFEIPLEKVTGNFLFFALAAYIIGHLVQPFSSGLLQRFYKNLRGKKLALLLKAYSELVGFVSCLLFSICLLIVTRWWNYYENIDRPFFPYYLVLTGAVVFFGFAVHFRKRAYDRKYEEQNGPTIKPPKQKVKESDPEEDKVEKPVNAGK